MAEKFQLRLKESVYNFSSFWWCHLGYKLRALPSVQDSLWTECWVDVHGAVKTLSRKSGVISVWVVYPPASQLLAPVRLHGYICVCQTELPFQHHRGCGVEMDDLPFYKGPTPFWFVFLSLSKSPGHIPSLIVQMDCLISLRSWYEIFKVLFWVPFSLLPWAWVFLVVVCYLFMVPAFLRCVAGSPDDQLSSGGDSHAFLLHVVSVLGFSFFNDLWLLECLTTFRESLESLTSESFPSFQAFAVKKIYFLMYFLFCIWIWCKRQKTAVGNQSAVLKWGSLQSSQECSGQVKHFHILPPWR